ncbi:MAG: ATP synthase F1 subunit delta [Pyrinomonadaceae bacterium]|nr:ATP synthase F1 subunit delta [Pyrinomonadaceae bacterium]MCX7639623.1 ATP synthase F1 subunit delta [Pyrinomonadaceae bacterium]MDW8303359.1 ATP synthase F1 subunit delta [Acidobacteriota bacterium]
MGTETIARRYAIALAEVAEKRNQTEEIRKELEQMELLLAENKKLAQVFSNPVFNHESKEKILETLIQKTKPLSTTANFLRVLLRNSRFAYLPLIRKSFEEVIAEKRNEVCAKIVSARDLSEKEQEELIQNLEKRTGKRIKLEITINPEVIGGIVATVGSTVFDGSIKNRLEILRDRLMNNV